MGLRSMLTSCLFSLGLFGICAGHEQDVRVADNCTDHKHMYGQVFSVPGDMAMLTSTLVSPYVLNLTSVPYNLTWFKTDVEMTNQTGRILVHGETLWFLNITVDDGGSYLSVLRNPSQCYKQVIKLVVDLPIVGECGKPKKAEQTLDKGVTGTLMCPVARYIKKLVAYNVTTSIKWYRGCEPIVDGTKGFTYRDKSQLLIDEAESHNSSSYTCTLTFTLGGVTGSVSETIFGRVKEDHCVDPHMHKPANETIKVQIGASLNKTCRVFAPCVGEAQDVIVDINWVVRGSLIQETDRVKMSKKRYNPGPKGVWVERQLMFSELREEDFYINYTCQVVTDKGWFEGYFNLQPTDPNVLLPIGFVLGGFMLLFIICVVTYYLFKVEVVLWFRSTFPLLYTNKDLDGKLYDAYVAFPQPGAMGFNKEVETFALHTLPQVLEKACGYKLFIPGRDCLPGQAIVDLVQENVQASRLLLLLYTAPTFTNQTQASSTTGNNKVSNKNNSGDTSERQISGSSNVLDYEEDIGEVCADARQQLEHVEAMHRTLLEGSLKVVLVELEEITPAQLALFPESVRHLRGKQGAVCWWKNLRAKGEGRRWRGEDEETGGQGTHLSPSLSPSSRFWKEMRYHMPVRGKRVMYPEKTSLLTG